MLKKLYIENVALIDSVTIDFTSGLNVLSGETGAGKSVILESLNFVLGAKADKTLIRNGKTECLVKAEFLISCDLFTDVFNECDIDAEDLLIISRKFTLDGKSSIKINGNSVTASMLKKFTTKLVDVHGQSEHFNLLKNANQLALIDSFGDADFISLKGKIKGAYSSLKDVNNSLSQLGGDETHRLIRLDVLNYQIAEIEQIDLKDGEYEELVELKQRLTNREKIENSLSNLNTAINGEGGVSDALYNALRMLNQISSLSSEYLELSNRLDGVLSEIDDLAQTSSILINDLGYDGYTPDQVEYRLDQIKSLKKKYGQTYSEIQAFLDSAKDEKYKLENFNQLAEELLVKKKALEIELYDDNLKLSNIRKKMASEFSNRVVMELNELGMSKAQFSVNFSEFKSLEECAFDSDNGIDEIEFMFSANLGEPIKPLAMIISGGEMSRFMLAIKAQTAKYNTISTFVFDEIDTGISGNIASVVAKKFARISRDTQIIAISHLAQISAIADNNILIVKTEDGVKTTTTVKTLDYNQKIDEIIRLVGGDTTSESARLHALELISTANEYKKTI